MRLRRLSPRRRPLARGRIPSGLAPSGFLSSREGGTRVPGSVAQVEPKRPRRGPAVKRGGCELDAVTDLIEERREKFVELLTLRRGLEEARWVEQIALLERRHRREVGVEARVVGRAEEGVPHRAEVREELPDELERVDATPTFVAQRRNGPGLLGEGSDDSANIQTSLRSRSLRLRRAAMSSKTPCSSSRVPSALPRTRIAF